MAKQLTNSDNKPTHQEIALRAYALFEQNGRVSGRDRENWLAAEAQLIAERNGRRAPESNQSPKATPPKPAPKAAEPPPKPKLAETSQPARAPQASQNNQSPRPAARTAPRQPVTSRP